MHKTCKCKQGLGRYCTSHSYNSLVQEIRAHSERYFGLGPILYGPVTWEFSPLSRHGLVATETIARGRVIGVAKCIIKVMPQEVTSATDDYDFNY